jgi:hypothetical protein
MKNVVKKFGQFINENNFDMEEFRRPSKMRHGHNRGEMIDSNPFPKSFIDSVGDPLMIGKEYIWMGENITVDKFDDSVIYFDNGIQMHITDYIASVMGTEDENYEDAAGFPNKA